MMKNWLPAESGAMVRYGQHAPVVGQVVLKAVLCELAPDGVARSAHAGPVRTATLDHKAGITRWKIRPS